MKKSLGAASLLLGALLLGGCNSETTCKGIEPDGEVEELRPCPTGWKAGEQRNIQEDEFKSLEVVDLSKMKKKTTAPTTQTQPPKTAVTPTPSKTIPKYTPAPTPKTGGKK